ncbi:hypothetical protein JOF53_006509 [Crossiella equi]|uniref:DUF6545 domain-containing protein n=1 Tax=Crossiella equi TaxID=130796 RepID=A0ABS5AM40_9PSEU|nr:MAB_1171c family putative transporter [Crossiella equi]MBP2477637.1 hypothetical protein [Crossiella equi]
MLSNPITAAVLYGALLWALYKLFRAPRKWTLRAVVACLTCFLLQSHLTWPRPRAWIDSWTAPGVGKLIQNIIVLGVGYFLVAFFIIAASASLSEARRKLLLLSIPLFATAAILIIATFSIPADVRVELLQNSNARHFWAATFFLSQLAFTTTYYIGALYWTMRYHRIASQDTNRRLCHGLRIVAGGLSVLIFACLMRGVLVIVQYGGGLVPAPVTQLGVNLVIAGIFVLLIGVSYPGFATRLVALGNWYQRWRIYHQLRPLWTMFHEAYPEDSLSRTTPSRWRDLLSLRNVHMRYCRRVIEIRDGMVKISPYLTSRSADAASSPTPGDLAAELVAALRAQASGVPASTSATAVAQSDSRNLDDDARHLLTVAQALPAR